MTNKLQSNISKGKQSTVVEDPHLITVRMIKLSTPDFFLNFPMTCEEPEPLHKIFPHSRPSTYQKVGEMAEGQCALGFSDFLIFPEETEDVYLSEEFRCYISIFNHSTQYVSKLSVKVEMRSLTQIYNLVDSTNKPLDKLAPGKHHDYLIQQEAKKPEDHSITCTVWYQKLDGETKTIKTSLNFRVSSPLSLETKIHTIKTLSLEKVFLESRIENKTNHPLFLENIKFEPSAYFEMEDLNQIKNDGNDNDDDNDNGNDNDNDDDKQKQKKQDGTFSGLSYLQKNNHRQYLFKFKPKEKFAAKSRQISNLGYLSISWRTLFGNLGHLQTREFLRDVEANQVIEVIVSKIPEKIYVEKPFEIECEIQNLSNQEMDLKMIFFKEKMKGIMISGLSSFDIGRVQPQSSVKVPLQLFPLAPGLQNITGFGISDIISGRSSGIKDLISVFVEREN
ncbi:trafficking protein particle complex subunit 13 [Anaeramoeba ignava]|uniref:Trafficking protein particle complex subunit 13 n=1 Tax=Anaeramoeba ignava TaxID=1746090 RepID=A0A9Q0L6Y4_ANAIG|nr:trafficking protein particle complex subunit 13 [Anaeramoeba ignava]